ncbi:hypothetical protein [Afipia birgiae]|uniref:hypothetical protein n=1 Tax=Afipia birgiae TaxID=151414 RepID=UPI003D316045
MADGAAALYRTSVDDRGIDLGPGISPGKSSRRSEPELNLLLSGRHDLPLPFLDHGLPIARDQRSTASRWQLARKDDLLTMAIIAGIVMLFIAARFASFTVCALRETIATARLQLRETL